jgi:hypothetical protein
MKRQAGFVQIGLLIVALLAVAAGYYAFQTYNQSQGSVVVDQPTVKVVRSGDDLQALSEEVDQLALEDSEAEMADIEASLSDF